MTARVFISYRTSDGADKATALARDLDALFGQEQIFLDKDDLPAGSRWRDDLTPAQQAELDALLSEDLVRYGYGASPELASDRQPVGQ